MIYIIYIKIKGFYMSTLKNLNYKYYYIYKIVNLANKKSYVGFHATNKEFENDNYFGSSKTLNNAIQKYGLNNFIIGIIEYINVDDWKEKERYWINESKSHISQWGYNLTWGGDGRLGCPHSNETKEKISKIHKGKVSHRKGKHNIFSKDSLKKIKEHRLMNNHIYQTPEHRKKLSIAATGEKNSMYGKQHSQETRNKISKVHKNKKLSDETKRKIGDASRKRIITTETRNKISNIRTGLRHSTESILKMKISHSFRKKQTCTYCNKTIDISNYSRWHGDKCKFKNE